jgi:hypothetical protein
VIGRHMFLERIRARSLPVSPEKGLQASFSLQL